MDRFKTLFSRLRSKISSRILFTGNNGPKYLGRWTLHGCPTKIDTKVDWSNEDHCGPCGERKITSSSYSSSSYNPPPYRRLRI